MILNLHGRKQIQAEAERTGISKFGDRGLPYFRRLDSACRGSLILSPDLTIMIGGRQNVRFIQISFVHFPHLHLFCGVVWLVSAPSLCLRKVRMKFLKTLENPDPAVPRRPRPGLHHRQRRQRCRRHPDLLPGRSAVRYTSAVDHDSDHPRADRRAGDVRPHGSGHRQRPQRLIREEFGLRITFLMMIARDGQLRQRGHGVHRHRGQPAIVRTSRMYTVPDLRRSSSG